MKKTDWSKPYKIEVLPNGTTKSYFKDIFPDGKLRYHVKEIRKNGTGETYFIPAPISE